MSDQSSKPPIPNSYWVVPGRFAAGEYPGYRNSSEADARIAQMLDAGIDHFVDLTQPRDRLRPYAPTAQQQAESRGLSVTHESHPMDDLAIPAGPRQMAAALDAIDDAMGNGKTVYIHCSSGMGRTGTVVGCWLVRHGQSGDDALRQVSEGFRQMPKAPPFALSPDLYQQQDYVRDWDETPSQGAL